MEKSNVFKNVGSPGRSGVKGTVVDQLRLPESNNRDSFIPSPLSKTVLNDNTDIQEPRRESWWKDVDQSRDITEVMEERPPETNIIDEFDIEVLSQDKNDKKENYTLDLPESSGSESIGSIVIPQRRLFTHKENNPQKKFHQVIGTRDTLAKLDKQHIEDKPTNAGTKTLFGQGTRSKPIFPSALLNVSPDKTIANKTKELITEIAPPRNLFGHAGTKRKNMFADFIASESEDEIPEIKARRFTFTKQPEPIRRKSSASRGGNSSPASSITTDLELEDWRCLPSSTMMEHQLEDAITPGKRARLSKLIETRETINTNSTGSDNKSKQSDKSGVSKNVSNASSPAKNTKSNEKVVENLSPPKNMNKSQIRTANDSRILQESPQHDDGNKIDNLTHTINKTGKQHTLDADKLEATNNQIDNLTRTINKSSTKQLSESKTDEIQEATNNQVDNLTRTINKSSTKQLSESKTDEIQEATNNQIDNLTRTINKSSTKQLSETKTDEISKINIVTEIDNLTHTLNNSKQLSKSHVEAAEKDMEIQLASIVGQDDDIANVQSQHDDDENITLRYDEHEDDHIPNKDKTPEAQDITNAKTDTTQKEKTLVSETPMVRKSKSIMSKVVNETPEDIIPEEDELQTEIQDIEQDEDAVFKPSQELERSINIKVIGEKDIQAQEPESDAQQKADINNVEEMTDAATEVEHPDVHPGHQLDPDLVDYQIPRKYIEMETDQLIVSQKGRDDEVKEAKTQEMESERHTSTNDIDELEEIEVESDNEEEKEHDLDNQNKSEHNDENISMVVADEEQDEELEENQEEDDGEQIEELEQEESQDEDQDIEEPEEHQEIDDEDQNEEELNESQEIENEENEEEENSQEVENEEDENSQEVENEEDENSQEIENEDENSQEIENEDENSQEIENEDEDSQEIENEENNENNHEVDNEENEEEIMENSEQESSEIPGTPNESHDTTGRHRNKHLNSPEELLLARTNPEDSFTRARGRNTSIRKSILKKFSIQPSFAPPRESTGLSDGTKNSSAEGSGWDSHRNERKTLRLTFGKDFTPRKSLRALVMEKSAKRQTIIDGANADLGLHQANSTEQEPIDDCIDDHDGSGHDYEDETTESSDVEVSLRTRQTTLEQYLQKIKVENMARKRKIEEKVRSSMMLAPSKVDVLNSKVPTKLTIRKPLKTLQLAPKGQRAKRTLIALEDLPPELIEDMKYKPPKRFRASNAPWITKRLYSFLESKLEANYDYQARIRAEKLVESIYTFARELRKQRVASPHSVNELKHEMARQGVVKTHYEFYHFFNEFMPREVRFKVVPDIVNNIPTPRGGVFSDIMMAE